MTKEEFEGLSGKAQWDVKVALRGPDVKRSNTAKWFTTSVIRHKVSNIMRVGGTVNDHLNLIIIPDNPGAIRTGELLGWDASHFINHIIEAAQILSIRCIPIPTKVWVDACFGDTANERRATKLFIEALEELKAKYDAYSTGKYLSIMTELKNHYAILGGDKSGPTPTSLEGPIGCQCATCQAERAKAKIIVEIEGEFGGKGETCPE